MFHLSAQIPFRLLTFISLAQGPYIRSLPFLSLSHDQLKNNSDGIRFADYGTVTIYKS